MFPEQWWIVFLTALVFSSLGFKKYVWFMTIGYGVSIGGISFCLLIMSIVKGQFSGWYMVLCLLLMIYGFRLCFVHLLRERRIGATDRKRMDGVEKHVSLTGLTLMWIFDSVMFFAMMSPVFYRLANGTTKTNDGGLFFGLFLVFAGIVVETIAEVQKYLQKIDSPKLPPMQGLYRFSRCPDYFGEIMVWTGVVVTGIKIVTGAQWVILILGYACVFHMMINGAKRIEMQQMKRFSGNSEYMEYVESTPVLVPFLPIYHLVKRDTKKKTKRTIKNKEVIS